MKAIFYSGVFGLLMLGVVIASGCKKDTKEDDPLAPTTIKDIDGNVYPVVKVGEQYWMGENLRTTKYRNGNVIPTTTPLNKNVANLPDSRYQWPQNHDESLAATWGRVYTAMAVTDIRGLCPQGWRVPSVDDFEVLIQYLEDHKPADYNSFPEMILSPDPGHWQFPSSMIGTPKNSTGLSLRGGGIRLNFAIDPTAFWQSYQQVCWLSTSTLQTTNSIQYFHYDITTTQITLPYPGGGGTKAAHVRCLME